LYEVYFYLNFVLKVHRNSSRCTNNSVAAQAAAHEFGAYIRGLPV